MDARDRLSRLRFIININHIIHRELPFAGKKKRVRAALLLSHEGHNKMSCDDEKN